MPHKSSIVLIYLFPVHLIIFRYKIQTVAIKIVHKGETPEEISKREGRFAREVAMLSRVQHKNLVKVGFFSYSLNISNEQENAIEKTKTIKEKKRKEKRSFGGAITIILLLVNVR